MTINNKFSIGQSVYLIHDLEQNQRMVVAVIITKAEITYQLNHGIESSTHYDFEISEEKRLF